MLCYAMLSGYVLVDSMFTLWCKLSQLNIRLCHRTRESRSDSTNWRTFISFSLLPDMWGGGSAPIVLLTNLQCFELEGA